MLLEMAVRRRKVGRAHQVLFLAEVRHGMSLEVCQRRLRVACVTGQETEGDLVELLVRFVHRLVAKKARVGPDEAVVACAAGSFLVAVLWGLH